MRNLPPQRVKRTTLSYRCRIQLLRPLRQKHQRQQRPRLRQRHQVLRAQRRQPRRPPAHRHVCAKSTAASAALRGCVPRCCLPHPRWRTPLWAEEVCAGCACQHSTAWFVRVCYPMY
ncbi:mucin TcMUCII [Trypanosoma cruzi Dm28c]|uniref:Mucin TcMUCII n=1 Tax=Trypanosoma cruzi Dm28c TaxID=1416333 RepID=V5DAF5_TRYCR|nr:mucin TcMUCII [Trypanosoma cruzi Dm28c]